MLRRLLGFVLAWTLLSVGGQSLAQPIIRIGALSFQSPADTLEQWTPTVQYLTRAVPGYRFEIVPMDYETLSAAVKTATVDFVLTNPEHYVVLRNVFGISPMATLRTVVQGQPFDRFGSVIFTRSDDKRIQTLGDARGKRIAAVGLYSLGGFLMAADIFRQQHLDLRSSEVQDLRFIGLPHSRVVTEVMAGRSDVGIVRTGVLEQMAARGQLDLANVRILNEQPRGKFPQALSTDLYPEWPWAAMSGTSADLTKAVTLALLLLEPTSPAALGGRFHSFGPPANYAPVEELMRRLKVYPDVDGASVLEDLWEEYSRQIQGIALMLLFAGLGMSAFLWNRNRRLHELTLLYQQSQAGLQVTAAAFDSEVGLLVTDTHTHIVRANAALCRMFGYTEPELLGQTTALLRGTGIASGVLAQVWSQLKVDGQWKGEVACRQKSGLDLHCMVTIKALGIGSSGPTGFVGSFVDISDQKATEQAIRQLAFYDTLTELPNRRMFLENVQEALLGNVRQKTYGALLFIDLDHFKMLNDTHGHTVGDQLLKLIAKRLSMLIGENDMAARLGGDEFVVMLTDCGTDVQQATMTAMQVGETLREAILAPYQLNMDVLGDNQTLRYSCSGSIGVALFGAQDENRSEILKRADVAMYQAKHAGRNAIRLFDPTELQLLNERMELNEDLNGALAANQLRLHYQLQVGADGRAEGAECLLRWQHPVRGNVSPVEFIALAEESGSILAIGEWVLRQACLTLAAWAMRREWAGLSLSVNVSPRQFTATNFVPQVLQILGETGAPPGLLVLEITEGIVLDNSDLVIEKMNALRQWGVVFSIDDFGTGYSSLSYLQRLPLSEIKIDKSFVQNLTDNAGSQAIVRAIMALANTMQLRVVAEGMETPQQKEILLALGCHRMQGYFIARPMELAAMERLHLEH